MRHFFIVFFCFHILQLSAQYPYLTQFYANPLHTNPAMAGNAFFKKSQAGRSVVQYRNQIPGSTLQHKMFLVGWDQPFDALKGGLGASYSMDVAGNGFLTTNSLSSHYAVSFKTRWNSRLRMGLQAGVVRKSMDNSRLYFGDQINLPNQFDPNAQILTRVFPFFNTGLLLTGEKYFIGGTLFHLNQPNQSFYNNPHEVIKRSIAIHVGYSFIVNELFSITPMVQFQKQPLIGEVLGGTLFRYRFLMAGLWYRQTLDHYFDMDALAMNLGMDIKNFRINYSYDRRVSDARSAIPRSHEISLQYRWKTKQSRELESSALY